MKGRLPDRTWRFFLFHRMDVTGVPAEPIVLEIDEPLTLFPISVTSESKRKCSAIAPG